MDKLVLVPKGLLGLWRVGRDAEHRGPAFGEGVRQPGEVDGLPGAARRVRARIEKQHQFPAGESPTARPMSPPSRGRRKAGAFCALGKSGLRDRIVAGDFADVAGRLRAAGLPQAFDARRF